MLISETKIQKQIIDALFGLGWLVLRNHAQGVKYTGGRGKNPSAGIPDLLAIKNGKYVWIEVKTPKGKLSKSQEDMHLKLEYHGCTLIVATSVDDILPSFI